MKKYAGLLVLALLWSCNDRATSPDQGLPSGSENTTYGSSVVKLPALPLAKAAAGVTYKFILTISGDNMETMNFSWPVDNSGESFTIEKIPAGRSRMFEGVLYGSNNVTYEGKAYTDITGGEVAYVSLVLKKTGSAQVEVILDEGNSTILNGCYGLKGIINDIELSPYTLQILESNDGKLWAYIMQGTEQIGKFWGTVTDTRLDATIAVPELGIDAIVEGYVSPTGTDIKADVYSYDKNPIGSFYGYTTQCPSAPPQESDCETDTLSGPGSTSCKDTTTWKTYAADVCKQKGKMLTSYYFWSLCGDKKDPQFYEGVCFECCPVKE